ncbi:MAG: hypothetical protein JRJ60_19445, partial [Deltaproteobacteria bacterium]|nr:hypothetical protein [Deltaproteobacteria bacterium]
MSDNKTKLDRFSSFMVRHKLSVLLLILVATGAVGFGITKIKTNVILQHMFPHDHPYLKLHARFSQVFGSGGSGVVIVVNAKKGDMFNEKTLLKIKAMTKEIVMWLETYRLLTVSIARNSVKVVNTLPNGEIYIDNLMFPEIPANEQEMALLKK